MFRPTEGPEECPREMECPPSEGARSEGRAFAWQCDSFIGGTSKRLLERTVGSEAFAWGDGKALEHCPDEQAHVPGPGSHLQQSWGRRACTSRRSKFTKRSEAVFTTSIFIGSQVCAGPDDHGLGRGEGAGGHVESSV